MYIEAQNLAYFKHSHSFKSVTNCLVFKCIRTTRYTFDYIPFDRIIGEFKLKKFL